MVTGTLFLAPAPGFAARAALAISERLGSFKQAALAEQAGLSPARVQKVLAYPDACSLRTLEALLRAAEELERRPSRRAPLDAKA